MLRYRRDLIQLMDGLPKVAAELGVAEGFFSADMLRWGLDKLYCVDAWTRVNGVGDGLQPQTWHEKNHKAALRRLEPFGDKAVVLRGLTIEMASQVPGSSLGLLYLDADHSYQGVMADLTAWAPKVVEGGIIAGHDYLGFIGVKKAADEYSRAHGYKLNILHEDKDEDAGFWFRI